MICKSIRIYSIEEAFIVMLTSKEVDDEYASTALKACRDALQKNDAEQHTYAMEYFVENSRLFTEITPELAQVFELNSTVRYYLLNPDL